MRFKVSSSSFYVKKTKLTCYGQCPEDIIDPKTHNLSVIKKKNSKL